MKKFGMTPQRFDLLCKRCGECCKMLYNGFWYGEYCQYLTWDKDKKNNDKKIAICTVFETRLGRDCGNGTVCVEIDRVFQRAYDCPYNLYFPETKIMKQMRSRIKLTRF